VQVVNFQNIQVQKNSCKSECVAGNQCSGRGTCIEGAAAGQIKCDCPPGFSGKDCSTVGEPTVPPRVPVGTTTDIGSGSLCTTSGLRLVNPQDPDHRSVAYASGAAVGCEARFCSLAADGSETVVPSPSEAQLNATTPASSTCPAIPAIPAAKCGIVLDSVQAAVCIADSDCTQGFVCARVCADAACASSQRHCAKPSDSCAGAPQESSCDNVGFRVCSEQGPKRSSTAAELTNLDTVSTPPASMTPTKEPPLAAYLTPAEVTGCGSGPAERKIEEVDPWQRNDDGSSQFGVYFEPQLDHGAKFTPLDLGQAKFDVHAKAAFRTGVKLFGKEFDAIVADAHAELSGCKRDVKATAEVFGDKIVAVSDSVDNEVLQKACTDLESAWGGAIAALQNANAAAHEAYQMFVESGPSLNVCTQVRSQLHEQAGQSPKDSSWLFTNVTEADLDCENPAHAAAAATLAANVLIDNYKVAQQKYLSHVNSLNGARAAFAKSGSVPLGHITPFEIAGYSQTFFVGPIPITLDARLSGEWGINGSIDYALAPFGDHPMVRGNASAGPHIGLFASIFAGVGVPAVSIGVEGTLTLLTVDPSLNIGMTLQADLADDIRDVGAWTGDALPGFPRKVPEWQAPWRFGAHLSLSTLSGHFDAVARLRLFFVKKTWRKQIFAWKGFGLEKDLTLGGADSPLTKTGPESNFGKFGDAVTYSAVKNVTLADAPTNANPDVPFKGRVPGSPCTPVVK
jgi:hypothetical protein